MYKTVTLRRAYPDEVKVKVITSAQIPNTREAVYFMEPGTLNLSSLGVEGFLINYAGFYNLFGKLTSVISRKTFFQSIKSHGVTQIDMYEKRIIDNDLFLTLSPGTKGFVVGTLAVVKTICSKDLSSLALFNEGNYGYAFVDLRSELDANKPILTRPFTNEFKAPPGGIRLSVALEIYKTN